VTVGEGELGVLLQGGVGAYGLVCVVVGENMVVCVSCDD